MIKHIKNLIQTYKEDRKLNKVHDIYKQIWYVSLTDNETIIANEITEYFILKKHWGFKNRYRSISFGEDDSRRLARIIIERLNTYQGGVK